MAPPLAVNPTPYTVNAGAFGTIYFTGAVSGLLQAQSDHVPGDRDTLSDLSNGQVFIQKTDGLVQFFVQVGAYSLPSIGTPYLRSGSATNDYFGAVPQAFIKIVPNANFSIQVGKLPTLIGAEYTFTFENSNIERGLLWNQENAVNRGVQANFTNGPLAVSVSLNDGFYSNRYSWITGSATWTFSPTDNIVFGGGGNTTTTRVSTIATPQLLNNESIFDVIYTHTSGPWTWQPYVQYTNVPKLPAIGVTKSASTFGAALLVNYTFPSTSKASGWSIPARIEYITSSGNAQNGAPNLLYGPGSDAFSVTVTPTFQYKIFFIRGEGSVVDATSSTPGFAFGLNGTSKTQVRGVLEVGALF